MTFAPGWYADPNDASLLRWWDGSAWTSRIMASSLQPPQPLPASTAQAMPTAIGIMERRLAELQAEIDHLTRERDQLQVHVVETRDIFLLQEVGLYEYTHPLDSSVEYKSALDALDREMQSCIKAGQAVSGTKKWAINGSEKEGAKMVTDFCKLMLRAYNIEADNLVRTLKPYTVKTAVERLQKMRLSISKLGASMKIEITDAYHAIRIKELELTSDYLAKVAEEKERERAPFAQRQVG